MAEISLQTTQPKISGFFTKPTGEHASGVQNTPQILVTAPTQPDLSGSLSSTRPLDVSEDKVDSQESHPAREVIVIEDSPVKPTAVELLPSIDTISKNKKEDSNASSLLTSAKPTKPVHPFFAARVPPITSTSKHASKSSKVVPVVANGDYFPWPNHEFAHVGYSSTRDRLPHVFETQKHKSPQGITKTSSDLSQFVDLTLQHRTLLRSEYYINKETAIEEIPAEHRRIPAVARILNEEHVIGPNHQLWNDKFAPKRAEHVLQNQEQAIYLKSWLQMLEVQLESTNPIDAPRGVKRSRPAILRDVAKRKRRRRNSEDSDEIEDFIVEDDEDDGGNLDLQSYDDLDDDLRSIGDDLPRTATTTSTPLSSRSNSPLPPAFIFSSLGTRSRPSARRIAESSPVSTPEPGHPAIIPATSPKFVKFEERLANTIVLCGPCGSGKTAAVYACSEELQWKVFEFYPGIGKRSGSAFMNELGGAGENHRVGGTVVMDNENAGQHQAQSLGFLTSPSKKKNGVAAMSPISDVLPTQVEVRQSLILVEEADILYQSDTNFWPTLINFIRKSRRPVILTCNDVRLIPVDDLPLQMVLYFNPCDASLGTSYLQAIAIAEGRLVKRECTQACMEGSIYYPIKVDIPDQPMHPLPSEQPLFQHDLKKAINALQFHLAVNNTGERIEDNDVALLSAVTPEDTRYRPQSSNEEMDELRALGVALDAVSLSDALIDRRAKVTLEAQSIDRYGPSGDDIQGHMLLSKVAAPEEVANSVLCPRDEDMALWVASHAEVQLKQRGSVQLAKRGVVPRAVEMVSGEGESVPGLEDSMQLATRRREYQARIVQALDEKITLQGCLLPSEGCVLDYVPYMMEMARGEHGGWGWMSTEGRGTLLAERLVLPT
ncbi:SubName: Full=Uncharacterized protein {ECO:0000313/EMBL:CCA69957.1} [Serendipita indica DSM 11827]|nr:SubName: Full=Uncharacterized protein {ECO:0000313/EMBL:CCA69957.1} [Serendipita indica DSM 11827]